jgi:peptidoglycan biosynthesis protein MviN/MurJ (putative lipid II flippase)
MADNRKLAKNIALMSSAVFLSRIFGLIRDQVMAFFFGAGFLNDAFNVAYIRFPICSAGSLVRVLIHGFRAYLQ